jgi:A118 family predicted phage portal protein
MEEVKSLFEKLLKWLRSLLGQMFDQGADADFVLSDKMSSAIALWARMYEDGGPWCNEKSGIHSLRIPAAVASEFARLVTLEMQMTLSGSARATFLQVQLSPFLNDIRRHVEVGGALGGAVFKPYVTDQGLSIDIVQGDCFFPTTFDTSNRMTGAIFVEQIKRKNTIYTRAEHHELQGGVYTIDNKAFASRSSFSIGSLIDLASVPEWSGIQPSVTIQNVTKPLFAYFRIPQANKQDRHSPLGVSVFAEATDTIRDLDEQYGRYLWEYDGGQMAVDVAEDLLDHHSDGSVTVPKLQKRLYRGRNVPSRDQNFYEIFAPQLRDDAYRRGINTILQRIEFQTGLAYGTLSDPMDAEKTATEVNASKQRSYSTVHDIQKALQTALDDLLYAMDTMATLYSLAPGGSYKVAYDWDDSIVNEPSQQKQMFWQYVVAGKFPMWRYLVKFEGYTEDDAKAIADEAAQNSSLSDPFGFGQGGGGNATA